MLWLEFYTQKSSKFVSKLNFSKLFSFLKILSLMKTSDPSTGNILLLDLTALVKLSSKISMNINRPFARTLSINFWVWRSLMLSRARPPVVLFEPVKRSREFKVWCGLFRLAYVGVCMFLRICSRTKRPSTGRKDRGEERVPAVDLVFDSGNLLNAYCWAWQHKQHSSLHRAGLQRS